MIKGTKKRFALIFHKKENTVLLLSFCIGGIVVPTLPELKLK